MSPDRRSPDPTRREQHGLALLEVLVAFAIAAAALGVLYSGVLEGLRGGAVAARYQEALSHARSHLAVLGRGQPVVPGETAGDDGGGFHYRLAVVPVAATTTGEAMLYAVRITVAWTQDGRERSVVLDSQRLALGAGARP